MDAQPALGAAGIVVSDMPPDHRAQLLPAGGFPAIVRPPLEDTPEAPHRPVAHTLAHPVSSRPQPACRGTPGRKGAQYEHKGFHMSGQAPYGFRLEPATVEGNRGTFCDR